jgi:hypothetical protein
LISSEKRGSCFSVFQLKKIVFLPYFLIHKLVSDVCDHLNFLHIMPWVQQSCWWGSQTVVKRAIEMEKATDALIQLIKDHGRWVDPPVEE